MSIFVEAFSKHAHNQKMTFRQEKLLILPHMQIFWFFYFSFFFLFDSSEMKDLSRLYFVSRNIYYLYYFVKFLYIINV